MEVSICRPVLGVKCTDDGMMKLFDCGLLCVKAAKLAVERGWAINIGGGFHHCSADHGGGFCVYADISLAIHFLFREFLEVKKAMIIDLDAHQVDNFEVLCVSK
jgi:acetoin utilization deacetylase AcuC-like enzyme